MSEVAMLLRMLLRELRCMSWAAMLLRECYLENKDVVFKTRCMSPVQLCSRLKGHKQA